MRRIESEDVATLRMLCVCSATCSDPACWFEPHGANTSKSNIDASSRTVSTSGSFVDS